MSFEQGVGAEVAEPSGPLRKITDPKALRALAHPVRISILEQLVLRGPLTATQVGQLIGESPSSCSFHLRQLAKYLFVEEVTGVKGRNRPWQMASAGFEISLGTGSAELEAASSLLGDLLFERSIERQRNWLRARSSYPPRWRNAAGESEFILHLTAEELAGLQSEIVDLVMGRFGGRVNDPARRPASSLAVEMLIFSRPVEPPAGRAPSKQARARGSASRSGKLEPSPRSSP